VAVQKLTVIAGVPVTVIKIYCDCVTFFCRIWSNMVGPHPCHNYILGHSPSCSSKHGAYWIDPLLLDIKESLVSAVGMAMCP